MKDLSLIYEVKDRKVNDEKRTVIAGVLEEDILSANDRFYPAKIVRNAISQLPGKRSLIGHETNSPKDVVARITEAQMSGKVGMAAFKFGKDSVSDMMFSKIKDGLIDSVSIRASGETKRAKIGDKFVDVVEKLDIGSVDLVVEGGVSSAKVVKVFESDPKIVYEDSETKEEQDMEAKELQDKLSSMEKQVEELTKAKEASDTKVEEAEARIEDAKLQTYKESKLALITDPETRELVKDQVIGTSEKEIDESFDKQVEYLKKLHKSAKVEKKTPIIRRTDKNEEEKKGFATVNDLLESSSVDRANKVKVLAEIFSKNV